jgi:hypothetical protein
MSQYVRFEVLTAVVMKRAIFWDITPFSPENKPSKKRAWSTQRIPEVVSGIFLRNVG